MSIHKREFLLKVRSINIASTVFLNDVPVFSDQWRSETDKQSRVNHFILDGENQLKVVLHVPPDVESLPTEVTYSLSIEEVEGTRESHTLTERTRLDWALLSADEFPLTLEGAFNIPQAYGPWAWQSSEPIDMDSLNKGSLFDFIGEVKDALLSRDFARLSPFLAAKKSELSRAFGFPEDELEKDDRDLFETMFGCPNWSIEEWDAENLIFETMAGGQMLRVLRSNGKDLLRTARLDDLDVIYSLPLDLIKRSGQWIIIR